MSNVNMQNLFSLFILVSLVQGFRNDWDYDSEQRDVATRPVLQNNFEEIPDKTVITNAITVADEKFDDYELKKLFVKNFKLYKHLESEVHKNEHSQEKSPRRKTRDANNTAPFFGVQCLSCYANGTSRSDEKCYQGIKLPLKTCADAEHCFTEIHPKYLRRGCVLPGRVNRTFVCRCPLCNDKSTMDSYVYEYVKISDWAYDNTRLARKLEYRNLMCKVCETKWSDSKDINVDRRCRTGKNIDYMVCGHNQICYTNIDDETDFVSRGCINQPAFNSIYYFCNSTGCNSDKFLNPKIIVMHEEIKLKEQKSRLRSTSHLRTKSHTSSVHVSDLFLIILSIICKDF